MITKKNLERLEWLRLIAEDKIEFEKECNSVDKNFINSWIEDKYYEFKQHQQFKYGDIK